MISHKIASIFRNGSRTYFYSSVFFPADVRRDVFTLYAFVRVADDLVDQVPQDAAGFERFVERYRRAMSGEPSGDDVVDGFVELAERRGFDPAWTESFIDAMRLDLTKRRYRTLAETKVYMYGSAEVIGLYMAQVLGLPEAALPASRLLGRAMQYINFLRDVDEDEGMGRTYVPRDVLDRYGISGPTRETARQDPAAFAAMMRDEVARYRVWQADAESGYRFIPRRYRIPIQTAADMYVWTADRIQARPERVFEGKIKPSVPRLVMRLLRNAVAAAFQGQESAFPVGTEVVHPTTG